MNTTPPRVFNLTPHTIRVYAKDGDRSSRALATSIVSMPTAEWMRANAANQGILCNILCPATGPNHVVCDDKGQILGCKALELYYRAF